MSRTEYMRQLESLLQNIPDTEREEAPQFLIDDLCGLLRRMSVREQLGGI